MKLYPFFLWCSHHEVDIAKKTYLEMLAFGKGCVITNNTLVVGSTRYTIPDTFSHEKWLELQTILWDKKSGFDLIEDEIREYNTVWSNLKKRDKIRKIDRYLIDKGGGATGKAIIEGGATLKSLITVVLILRLIQTSCIKYNGYQIKSIDLSGATIPRKLTEDRIPSKISLRNLWNKVKKDDDDCESIL